jgi:uridylate kinase
MDSTAASLCRDNNIKIHVFGVKESGNMIKAVCGEDIGTVVE